MRIIWGNVTKKEGKQHSFTFINQNTKQKKHLPIDKCLRLCDSAATRTQNLLLRRQLLYPVELRNHPRRDSLIRTGDLLLPKQAR